MIEMEVYKVYLKLKNIQNDEIFKLKPDSNLINRNSEQMKTWEKIKNMTI